MLSLLRIRLHQAIYLQKDFVGNVHNPQWLNGGSTDCRRPLKIEDIPLKHVKNATRIVYSSAIAHRLAVHHQIPTAIAAQHVHHVLSTTVLLEQSLEQRPLIETVLQGATVHLMPTNLIQVELSDRAIAAWLNHLIVGEATDLGASHSTLKFKEANSNKELSSAIFAAQHAHARCCSLLRLADREGLIKLDASAALPNKWQIVSPAAIPWLTPTDQFCWQHPTVHGLMTQLVTADDAHEQIPSLSETSVVKVAQALAQAFEQFHRTHPLRSPSLTTNLQVLYTTLGLLLCTQRLLYQLLEHLAIQAPTEL